MAVRRTFHVISQSCPANTTIMDAVATLIF